jgi:adenylate cyclase
VLPGLPGPEERAVRAAVSIQREMQRLNAGRPVPLVTRIGINTGEVVMGVIGAGERKDYTVIGDQVNRGQRFEGKAHPGGVLVSEGTYREAAAWLAGQGDLCVEKLDGLLLKGIPAPVSAWSITLKGQP